MSHGGANTGKLNQVRNHNKSQDKFNGESINHMNIDDATVGKATESLNSILRALKPGEQRTLSSQEILNLFK